MTAESSATTQVLPGARPTEVSRPYEEGIVAGMIGAATIAIWFLILDVISGRPLYTPTVLGTALFRREGLEALENLAPNFEMALMFTWVHCLVFAVLGGVAARFIGLAEKNSNYGFGILLLFVIFMFGFIVIAMILAEGILQALTWPAILIGNLLAGAAMAVYFWRRHPNLTIRP